MKTWENGAVVSSDSSDKSQSPAGKLVADAKAGGRHLAGKVAGMNLTGKTCRMTTMMVLTTGFFVLEVVYGFLTNSMALIADSFHMLSDVLALVIGFACMKISKRQFSPRNTFGWVRAEVLGALVNTVFLMALSFSIILESIERLFAPEEVRNPQQILIVGAAGLAVNIVGLFLFHNHSHGDGGHGHSHGGLGGHGHSHGGHGHTHGGQDNGHSHECKPGHAGQPEPTARDKPVQSARVSHVETGSADDEEHTAENDPNKTHRCSVYNEPMRRQSGFRRSKIHPKQVEPAVDSPTAAAIAYGRRRSSSVHAEPGIESVDETFDQRTAEAVRRVRRQSSKYSVTADELSHNAKGAKRPPNSQQMNMRGVYLHVLGDAFGSIVVVVNALVNWFVKNWFLNHYLDPMLSLLMAGLIIGTSIPLLKESALVLLQTVPSHLSVPELKKKLLDQFAQNIASVHDFHIWRLTGNKIVATIHVRCHGDMPDYMKLAEKMKAFFHEQGIHSTTIQPELIGSQADFNQCALKCPKISLDKERTCDKDVCCVVPQTPRIESINIDIPAGDNPFFSHSNNTDISHI